MKKDLKLIAGGILLGAVLTGAYNTIQDSKNNFQVKPIKKTVAKKITKKKRHIRKRRVIKKRRIKKTLETRINLPDSKFLICNYWKDENKNNLVEYDELIGIKKDFRSNEKITLVGMINNKEGSRIVAEVRDWNNKLISRYPNILNFEECVFHSTYDPNELYQKGGAGTYTVKWYVDNKLAGVRKFNLRK